jgi:hypothetical protein
MAAPTAAASLEERSYDAVFRVGRLDFSRAAPMRLAHGDPLRRSKSYLRRYERQGIQ